jgi:hypothetical protein
MDIKLFLLFIVLIIIFIVETNIFLLCFSRDGFETKNKEQNKRVRDKLLYYINVN